MMLARRKVLCTASLKLSNFPRPRPGYPKPTTVIYWWCSRNKSSSGLSTSDSKNVQDFSLKKRTEEWLRSSIPAWRQDDSNVARSLLESWMRQGNDLNAKAQMTTRIYHKMMNISTRTDGADCSILVEILNRILHLWKQGETMPDSELDQALRLFNMTLQKSQELNNPSLIPQDKTFSIMFDLLASNASLKTLNIARSLLRDRMELLQLPSPDLTFWNSYLNVLAKCASFEPTVVDEAEEILESLNKDINEWTVASVLEVWVNSGRKEAGERAQNHLDTMTKANIFNLVCFNLTMRAWASAGYPEKAEVVLMQMLELSRDYQTRIKPDATSFLAVIRGWANAGEPTRTERVANLMQSMYEENRDEDLRPSADVLVALLRAWGERGNGGPKVEEILQSSIDQLLSDPDSSSSEWLSPQAFTVAIKAWSTTDDPDAPLFAEALIQQLEQLQRAEHEHLAPNAYHYSAAINTWLRSERTDAVDRVNDILQSAEEKCGPHVAIYNAALSVFAKHGCIHEAEELVEHMKSLQTDPNITIEPDSTSYAYLIRSYYNCRSDHAARKSLEILSGIEEAFDGGNFLLRPGVSLYHSVILAQSIDSVEAAEEVLWKMLHRHNRNHQCPSPDVSLVNLILWLWSCSDDGRSPMKAEDFLLKIQEIRNKDLPLLNDVSYLHVVRAWERSGRRSTARHVEENIERMAQDRSIKVRKGTVDKLADIIQRIGRSAATGTHLNHLLHIPSI